MTNKNSQNFTLEGVLTAQGTDQFLTPIGLLPQATANDAGLPSVLIDTNCEFQSLVGFGGAFTESAAVTWLKLSAVRREQVLKAYFDPENGHGYSFCRLHMGSCDFSLSNYAHVDTDDEELSSFSIARPPSADAIHKGRANCGRPSVATFGFAVEPTCMDENQWNNEQWWTLETGISTSVGELFRQIHQSL